MCDLVGNSGCPEYSTHHSLEVVCMGTDAPELFETKDVNHDPQARDIYSLGFTRSEQPQLAVVAWRKVECLDRRCRTIHKYWSYTTYSTVRKCNTN